MDKYIDDGVHWLIIKPDGSYAGGLVPIDQPVWEANPKIEYIPRPWKKLEEQLVPKEGEGG